jgi:outer membrane protein assembly factor BamB
VLCNLSADPTRNKLDGACLYTFKDHKPVEVWRDPAAKAVEPKKKERKFGIPPLVEKGGAYLELAMDENAHVAVTPFSEPFKLSTPANFSAVPALAGPSSPPLFAADLDGDGVNELALFQDPKLRSFKLKEGTFEQYREYTSSCEPVLADLNGDGKTDVVTLIVSTDATPLVRAVTPADNDALLWESRFPAPTRTGLPAPRRAYMRTAHFLGRETPDLYVWAGTPLVRSAGVDGRTGAVLWEKAEQNGLERYNGASVNFASACDYNGDGKEDLVFTCPDYYCVADGPTGNLLVGPLFPPDIFKQPSQGLYTFPAVLDRKDNIPLVNLVDGHYFQAAMTLKAEPLWYKVPPPGENRAACEGFLQLPDETWLMGFGRQKGNFACLNVADGSVRWELPLDAAASDTITCDIDGDGAQEFLFGTSHGEFFAVADDAGKPKVLWKTTVGAAAGAPIAADFNGDGASEIAVPTTDGQVTLLGTAPKAKGPVVKVEQVNGAPAFTLDGKPHCGLSFMSYTGSGAMGPDGKPLLAQYVKSLAGADCDLYTFVTDLGCLYGYSTTVWPEKDKWDFSQTDANARMIVESAGANAKLVIQLYIDAPKWWAQSTLTTCWCCPTAPRTSGKSSLPCPGRTCFPRWPPPHGAPT